MQAKSLSKVRQTIHAWNGRALFNLLVIAAFVLSFWSLRALWLQGPAPSYSVLAVLTRDGHADARLYDDDWYSAQVRAQTNGAVSDIFSPSLPTLPLLILPLAFVPAVALPALWAVVNGAALWAATRVPLALIPRGVGQIVFAAVIGMALFSAPLRENFERGQIYLLVLLLHAFLFWAVVQGRTAAGGAALSLLFALKSTGLPLWLVLLALRRWRSLAWAVLTLGVMVLLTLLVSGVDIWRVYLTQSLPLWVGSPIATVPAFQTLNGFFQHLFRYDVQYNPAPLWDAPMLATVLTVIASSGLLGISMARANRLPLPQVLGAGSVLSVCLMPLAEQYHFLVLLLPFGVAAALFAQFTLSARVLLLLSVALVFAPLPFKNPQWWQGAWALLAYPRLYGALMLWALLILTKADAR